MGIRIAFCSSEWNYDIIENATVGIHRFLDKHPDVQVITFRELGKYGTKDAGRGDHEIFSLPQTGSFDGFVIQGNQVWLQSTRMEYVRELQEKAIPVVSVNDVIEGSTYVGTDNRSAVYEMTRGMIEQVRKESVDNAFEIAFVRGLSRSDEAKHREQGFLDACREQGIEEKNIRMFDGSWSAEDGVAAANLILQNQAHLPRILVCANDDMAGAAAAVLSAAGIRIPEDIMIAGFDNLPVSSSFRPRLISVERDYAGTIEMAMETIYQMIQTGDQPAYIYSPYKILYHENLSDGLDMGKATIEQLQEEIWKLRQQNCIDRNRERQRYMLQDEIEPALLSCRTMGEILDVFEKFMKRFGEDKCYIAVNTDYRYGNEHVSEIRHFSEKMALAAMIDADAKGYSVNPITHCYEIFNKTSILPENIMEGKRFLDVIPLHYGEICIGYLVLESKSDYMDYACLESINTLMINAIENARTRALLQKMNDRLEEMYMSDSLSGLYNRYGLDTRGRSYFDRLRGRRKISFWFVDMDNMKGINDYFGHKAGDAAIAGLGHVIKKVSNTYGLFAMRYGGDEFLMFGVEDSERICREIQTEIDKIRLSQEVLETETAESLLTLTIANAVSAPHLREDGSIIIAASIGVYTIDVNAGIPLEACISAADSKMYENKKKRKRQKQEKLQNDRAM